MCVCVGGSSLYMAMLIVSHTYDAEASIVTQSLSTHIPN